MCGLSAEFAYAEAAAPVSRERLERASAAMAARGPDGAGLWISDDARVGFAHRRLAIVDLSDAGAQPMATADGSVRIVFNGEIYNFRALREELVRKGHRFRSRSDTEVLLELYLDRGPAMVRALRGMFAFALWDERKRTLLLARDPLGIKPLYYVDDGSCLRVASQVKALIAANGIDLDPEPAGHVGFFLWGHVPEPWTLYRGIRALPAGATLAVAQHGRVGEPRSYFELTAELAGGSSDMRADGDASPQIRFAAALKDSVGCHMLADVPVGVFLSSGLDSSAIAALAAEHSDEPLRTITLGFEEFAGSANDEVPLAEALARDLGFAHTSRAVRREDFAALREHVLSAMDQPTIDGVNTYFVSRAAHESGLKVALSGLGGDELLSGYSSFADIPRIVHYAKGLAGVGRGFRWVTAPLLRHFTSPKYAGLLEYGGDYGGAYLLRRGLFMPWELPELLDGEIVRDGWRALAIRARLEETTAGIASARLRVSALEMAWYMRNQLLRDTDWASMAHSLEVRVPLVDAVLLREVANLVASGHAPSKKDMAACAPRPLPDAMLARPKSGFSIPVRSWLEQAPAEWPDSPRMRGLPPARGSNAGTRGLRGWARTVYRHFVDA